MKARSLLLCALLLGACSAPAGSASPAESPTLGGPPPSVLGTVTAGPVCPVEQVAPASQCAARPVVGAVIVATDTSGQVVGRATSATDGSYLLTVPATGTFVITGLPVAGLMGVPAPATVTLALPSATAHVNLEYDTGIR